MTNREQTEPADRPMVHGALDEIGEASFPASDPPQSWTWEVERDPAPARYQRSSAAMPSESASA